MYPQDYPQYVREETQDEVGVRVEPIDHPLFFLVFSLLTVLKVEPGPTKEDVQVQEAERQEEGHVLIESLVFIDVDHPPRHQDVKDPQYEGNKGKDLSVGVRMHLLLLF
jgi:hypothetical protein